MPISRVFVTRFFQLVTSRRFAEAERVLERIKLRVQETEWNRGYFQALNGILLAQKSSEDQYAFLSNLNFENEGELKKYRRNFLKEARNKIHADYDRGFFSAWADYLRVSIRLRENPDEHSLQKSSTIKREN